MQLKHHGIRGQKWGVRHGPPYPIKNKRKVVVDNKTGSLYNIFEKGKEIANTILAHFGNTRIDNGAPRRLPRAETIEEVIQNTNPHRDDTEYMSNCVNCGFASYLRTLGYDVTAGKQIDEDGVNQSVAVEDCFINAKVLDGSARSFAESRDKAASIIRKRFGDDSFGLIGVKLRFENRPPESSEMNHTFSWITKNGKVQFFDSQQRLDDYAVSNIYWNYIDPNSFLKLSSLNDTEIKWDKIKDYLE